MFFEVKDSVSRSYQSLAGRDAVGAAVQNQPVRSVAADGDEAGGRIVEQICRNLSETQIINAVTAGLMNIPAHNMSGGVNVMEAQHILYEQRDRTKRGPTAEIRTDTFAVAAYARSRCGRGIAFPYCVGIIVPVSFKHLVQNFFRSAVSGV